MCISLIIALKGFLNTQIILVKEYLEEKILLREVFIELYDILTVNTYKELKHFLFYSFSKRYLNFLMFEAELVS